MEEGNDRDGDDHSMKTEEYIERDKAHECDRTADEIVMVCESCGDISRDPDDKEHRHCTAFTDGSYGYYMPRAKYRMTLTKTT